MNLKRVNNDFQAIRLYAHGRKARRESIQTPDFRHLLPLASTKRKGGMTLAKSHQRTSGPTKKVARCPLAKVSFITATKTLNSHFAVFVHSKQTGGGTGTKQIFPTCLIRAPACLFVPKKHITRVQQRASHLQPCSTRQNLLA
jgi:hypothetical protein